jgi:hypothetical protein
MDNISAKLELEGEKYFITIHVDIDKIRIPISENKPNEVKSAFNKLIQRLKLGEFNIELEEVGTDLFSHVATEYIKQLNLELSEIYAEMESLELLDESEN